MSIELWHDEDGDLIRPGNLDPEGDGEVKVTYYSEREARDLFGGGGSSCEDCSDVERELRDEIDDLRHKLSNAEDYIGCARSDIDTALEYIR